MTEPVCDVSYDPQVSCLVMQWKGYATSEQFRDANERVLTLLRERSARKLLCDAREFKLIHGEEQAWLNRDWIPRAIQAGLRTCAMVMPVFHFNRVAIETVTSNIDPTALRVHFFEDGEAARRWLRDVAV